MKKNELACALFRYDPETGRFFRKAKLSWKRNLIKVDEKEIVSTNAYGYIEVNFSGKPCAIHRIIFLMLTGKFPENDVDHLDGNRTNNKLSNLRLVTRKENLRNVGIRSDNLTGFHGVSLRKDTGKFTVYIDVDGIRYRGGNFLSLKDAIEKRDKMSKKYNFHPNHGGRKGWVR